MTGTERNKQRMARFGWAYEQTGDSWRKDMDGLVMVLQRVDDEGWTVSSPTISMPATPVDGDDPLLAAFNALGVVDQALARIDVN